MAITLASVAAYVFYDPTSPVDAQITHSTPAIGKPDGPAALTELFGDSDTESHARLWFAQDFSIDDTQYHVVFGKKQFIDTETGLVFDSHAQGAGIGAISYRLDFDGWRVVNKQHYIAEIGSWGEAPDISHAETLRLSPTHVALLIDFGYGMGGYFDFGNVLLSFDGAEWRDLGFIRTGGNNEGACDETPSASGVTIPCWSYDGEMSVLAEWHHGYPDLSVRHQGTRSGDDQAPVSADDIVIYRFNGEKYIELTQE